MGVRHDDDETLPGSQPPATPSSRPPGSPSAERYDMGPLLGRGGMGEVRLARDTRIDREVAVKLMRSELRDSPNVARFFREARVQGALEHPSVVPVHDLGIDPDGNPYFVMKRLAGRTFADVLTNRGEAWSRNELLSRFADVCLAVEFAHQRGVVHRDLKPANIMVGDYGETYVLDWGLARVGDETAIRGVAPLSGENDSMPATLAGDLLGTPGYMAPEQARGTVVTAAADVFSLGCVLFEILVGEAALPRGTAAIGATLAADEHRPSTRPGGADVPPELDALTAAATDHDPEVRPTARGLADKIRAYLEGDRDLGQRKELAAGHAARALAAFAQATGRADEASVIEDTTATTRRAPMSREQIIAAAQSGPQPVNAIDARGVAMREAGRALVLDSSNRDAQTVLSRLLLEPPRELPPEVVESVEQERARALQQIMRGSVYPYLALVTGFLLLFMFPVHHPGPILGGAVICVFGVVLLWAMSREPLVTTSRWYKVFLGVNIAGLTVGSVVMGPLLLFPVFTIGSLTALLAQPVQLSRALVIVLHAIPLIGETILERLDILPHTFEIYDGGIMIKPWVLDLTPRAAIVVFFVGVAIQFINSATLITIQRAAQMKAQQQLHAQAWQLKQLDPSAKS